ncbi:unnamed protein product, partial [Discosporangium mesarthrocarpum]
ESWSTWTFPLTPGSLLTDWAWALRAAGLSSAEAAGPAVAASADDQPQDQPMPLLNTIISRLEGALASTVGCPRAVPVPGRPSGSPGALLDPYFHRLLRLHHLALTTAASVASEDNGGGVEAEGAALAGRACAARSRLALIHAFDVLAHARARARARDAEVETGGGMHTGEEGPAQAGEMAWPCRGSGAGANDTAGGQKKISGGSSTPVAAEARIRAGAGAGAGAGLWGKGRGALVTHLAEACLRESLRARSSVPVTGSDDPNPGSLSLAGPLASPPLDLPPLEETKALLDWAAEAGAWAGAGAGARAGEHEDAEGGRSASADSTRSLRECCGICGAPVPGIPGVNASSVAEAGPGAGTGTGAGQLQLPGWACCARGHRVSRCMRSLVARVDLDYGRCGLCRSTVLLPRISSLEGEQAGGEKG